MTAVIGYPYSRMGRFMRLCLDNLGRAISAVQNRRAGRVGAEHQLEPGGRSRQPVLLLARSVPLAGERCRRKMPDVVTPAVESIAGGSHQDSVAGPGRSPGLIRSRPGPGTPAA